MDSALGPLQPVQVLVSVTGGMRVWGIGGVLAEAVSATAVAAATAVA